MKIFQAGKHLVRECHSDPKNIPWFNSMHKIIKIDGYLSTSNGSYLNTKDGFIPVNNDMVVLKEVSSVMICPSLEGQAGVDFAKSLEKAMNARNN